MQITSVTYSRLINLGNYENERLDATAVVPDGQTPEGVYQDLKDWVHQQLGITHDIDVPDFPLADAPEPDPGSSAPF